MSSDAELGVRELASANAKEHLEDLEEEHSGGAMAQLVAASYGVVAALMCAPVMMSFASIIFSDPFFAPYMPSLVKLVLCSAAIHQLCYALGSFSRDPCACLKKKDVCENLGITQVSAPRCERQVDAVCGGAGARRGADLSIGYGAHGGVGRAEVARAVLAG